jgi:integrase
MPVRRNARGVWIYRKVVKLRDGSKVRIFGTPDRNTREAAEEAEREHIERVKNPAALPVGKAEVPTFAEWFWGADAESEEPNGRFWNEWVIGRKNKPGEAKEKKAMYRLRLQSEFGDKRLDEIGISEIAQFRAKLVLAELSDKTINNTLAVLSKPLKYAADIGLIKSAPKVGLIKVERPEFVCWEVDEYARILDAAKVEEPEWYAGICLAGEAGLRAGEIRGLRWNDDVDMTARTITVNQQIRQGMLGTPKGRTRRTIQMTETLRQALRKLAAIGGGYVLRNADGSPKTDGQTKNAIYRVYKRAGLEERDGGWHVLRHSFGTHAALLGVNPWTLMRWMVTSGSTRRCCTSISPMPIGAIWRRLSWKQDRKKLIRIGASSPC